MPVPERIWRRATVASRTPPTLQGLTTKKIHHFAYLRGSFEEQPRPHELRDGDAFGEIHAALHELGYRFGGLHLNYPVPPENDAIPSYDSSDVIVLTTRPPLDDVAGWDRRRIERSNTKLEREILRHIRPCFKTCKRTVIQLARSTATHLGPYADRAYIRFRLYEKRMGSEIYTGAHYQHNRDPHVRRTATPEQTAPRTAAFLLVRRLEPKGPMLMAAFGMDGIMTLAWCYLLRTKFAHLLTTQHFVMAEIQTRDIPKRPSSLAFAETWPVQIILDAPLDLLGPPSIDADHAPP